MFVQDLQIQWPFSPSSPSPRWCSRSQTLLHASWSPSFPSWRLGGNAEPCPPSLFSEVRAGFSEVPRVCHPPSVPTASLRHLRGCLLACLPATSSGQQAVKLELGYGEKVPLPVQAFGKGPKTFWRKSPKTCRPRILEFPHLTHVRRALLLLQPLLCAFVPGSQLLFRSALFRWSLVQEEPSREMRIFINRKWV